MNRSNRYAIEIEIFAEIRKVTEFTQTRNENITQIAFTNEWIQTFVMFIRVWSVRNKLIIKSIFCLQTTTTMYQWMKIKWNKWFSKTILENESQMLNRKCINIENWKLEEKTVETFFCVYLCFMLNERLLTCVMHSWNSNWINWT